MAEEARPESRDDKYDDDKNNKKSSDRVIRVFLSFQVVFHHFRNELKSI